MTEKICQAVLKSGNNKGKICGKSASHGLYCGVHKNLHTQIKDTTETIIGNNTCNSDDGESPQNDRNKNCIIEGDFLKIAPTLEPKSFQIIIADPPYNIGKDFGNDSDKQSEEQYLSWCEAWINECLKLLKDNGTMFIYGFSETLALILSKLPKSINRRWIIWHYTNKTVPSLNFWQRSHESILVVWKNDKIFNRDDIREEYTEEFLEGAAGKERPATIGRFSKGNKTTTYTAHPQGALPRDVIKLPTLAGGNGRERAFIIGKNEEKIFHPTQKPLALCKKLILSCLETKNCPILIPFAGSGSECIAAKELGIPYIGIEINPTYIKLIEKRLS